MRKGVVEVYGGLPLRKNLHGSMGLSTYWVEDEENKRRWKKMELGVRGEKRERWSVGC